MKIEICVIKVSSQRGYNDWKLEIGNNISLEITSAMADEVIKNLKLPMQESDKNENDGSVTELYY